MDGEPSPLECCCFPGPLPTGQWDRPSIEWGQEREAPAYSMGYSRLNTSPSRGWPTQTVISRVKPSSSLPKGLMSYRMSCVLNDLCYLQRHTLHIWEKKISQCSNWHWDSCFHNQRNINFLPHFYFAFWNKSSHWERSWKRGWCHRAVLRYKKGGNFIYSSKKKGGKANPNKACVLPCWSVMEKSRVTHPIERHVFWNWSTAPCVWVRSAAVPPNQLKKGVCQALPNGGHCQASLH